jgi:hypothetical protein
MRIRNILLWTLFFLIILGLFKYLSQDKDSKTLIPITKSPFDTTLFNQNEDGQAIPQTTDTVVPLEWRGDSTQQLM